MAQLTADKIADAALERGCSVEDVWKGIARMAHARHLAGVPLAGLDAEAIRRYPTFEPCRPR